MASETISPNMSLPIPGVGLTSGPQFASDINNSLTIIDGHTHSLGSGVPITPSGLNINSALAMNNQMLSLPSAINFQAQITDPLSNSIYSKGVDLYYIDGSGNIIRITQSGAVSGATGTITGLPSGTASAAYAAGTFVFQSATNTGASVDGASFIFRNSTASSFGLTLQPPNSLANNYTLTLPTIPGQTNVMTLDASGNMGSITYDAVGQAMTSVGANAIAASRTRASGATVGIGGVATSVSSGVFSTTSASFVTVPNLTVTITTSGRPIFVGLQDDPTGTPSFIGGAVGTGRIVRVLPTLFPTAGQITNTSIDSASLPSSSLSVVDSAPSGLSNTYTYVFQINSSNGVTSQIVNNVIMVAYEL